MSLNIKKPNYINTSKISSKDINLNLEKLKNKDLKHPFLELKNLLEKSWSIKNIDIKSSEKDEQKILETSNLNITLDNLKNKSLISYIDAPWGSGKTYFIENLVKWIKFKTNEKDEIKFKFNQEESYLDINVLDAWEIYSSSNITDVLFKIYSINFDELNNFLEKNNISEKIESNIKKNRLNFLKRFSLKEVNFNINLPFVSIGTKIGINKKESKELVSKISNSLKEYNDEDILISIYVSYLEHKYRNNNKLVILDNIERLSSQNRLDIINKILNWANISGTTFLFLTNFEKIKFTKLFEEDFWNKISLQETFKLINNWETYVEQYKIDNFELSEFSDAQTFILNMIPLFFKSNNDNMDIREIKKLLDNWEEKNHYDNNKDLIKSFIKDVMLKNLEGLDKYFFINSSISWLSENKWDLWKGDYKFEKEDNIDNTPLINNKMIRIQSNFYDLNVHRKDDKIKFSNNNLKIRIEEKDFFDKFNNFIDNHASSQFQNLIKNVLKTREISNPNNYINSYLKIIKKNEIKYFEFKYNNIKKLHIYNDIFNSQ